MKSLSVRTMDICSSTQEALLPSVWERLHVHFHGCSRSCLATAVDASVTHTHTTAFFNFKKMLQKAAKTLAACTQC